jgi:hypothetical protein
VGVGHDLDLDVPAVLDELLQQQGVVPERAGRLAARRDDGLGVLLLRADDPHPLAATTGRGLHQDGVGQLLAERDPGVGHRVGRDDGDPGRHGDLAGSVLAGHGLHRRDRRPDPGQACVGDGLGEGRVLGQEAVAGVDRLGSGGQGGGDHGVGIEVRGDPDHLVGGTDVQGFSIEVRGDGDRADAEAAARPDDAQRDLAAVGDEDGLEHRRHILKTP